MENDAGDLLQGASIGVVGICLLACWCAILVTSAGLKYLRVPFERFDPIKDIYMPRDYYTGFYSSNAWNSGGSFAAAYSTNEFPTSWFVLSIMVSDCSGL